MNIQAKPDFPHALVGPRRSAADPQGDLAPHISSRRVPHWLS